MEEFESHTSPDGLLRLVVLREETHGNLIAFDDYPWHTHGDILAECYGGTPESATRDFVDMILASQAVIVISRVAGLIRDAWVTDDPDYDDMKYAAPNETIEKRYWDGTAYTGRGLEE